MLFFSFSKLELKEELPAASWAYCFPAPLLSQEQLRGKAPTPLLLVQKWGIIFGNTPRLAGANGGFVDTAFSFFVIQM